MNVFSCFTSNKPAAAFLVLALTAALLTGRFARAEQLTQELLNLSIPERLLGGEAQLQMRAGYAAGTGTEVGALLQPRIDFRSGAYGHLFAAGTGTSGVPRSTAAPSTLARNNRNLGNLKQLYGGWSSGRLFGGLGEDALTLSFGRETIEDASGTLKWAGEDESCDAACWLSRSPTGFQSLSARLKTGSVRGQTFYVRSRATEGPPAVAGMSATVAGSALGLGASLAALVREDRLAVDSESLYGRLEATYKFAMPWSPTLTSGYGFISAKPDDAATKTSGSIPVAHMQVGTGGGGPLEHISGNRVAEVGLSAQPFRWLTLEAAFKTLVCGRRAQGVALAAEWQPSPRLSLRMLGGLSDTGTQFTASTSDTDPEARLAAALTLGF